VLYLIAVLIVATFTLVLIRFVALSLETGIQSWDITVGGRIESSAAVSHCQQFLIVGTFDQTILNVFLIRCIIIDSTRHDASSDVIGGGLQLI
jgi:hypothetical protein